MNLLVLGGTGAMGAYLTQILSESASRIVVTSRQKNESHDNIQYVQGDAKNSDFLEHLLKNHWDAIIDFMIYSTHDFSNRVNHLLAATDQYFFLSSARVYADSDKPLTEDSPRLLDVSTDAEFLATDAYPLAKARQENCLFEHAKKNWTIIRPYITYGSERLQLGVLEKEAWLYRALRGRSIVFSEDIATHKTTMAHGQDVAQAMACLVGETAALGEVFHIAGPHCQTWDSVLDLYVKSLAENGLEVNIKKVDLDSFACCHSGRYQIIYDRLYHRVFENKKIDQFVDTMNFVSIEVGLHQCINTFLNNPRFKAINWSFEGIKDKICGEMTSMKEINNFKEKLRYFKYKIFQK